MRSERLREVDNFAKLVKLGVRKKRSLEDDTDVIYSLLAGLPAGGVLWELALL